MDLILWRHAEAQDWTEGCNDLERQLTPRGEKQAQRMAAWLDRQLPEGARVVCSPARRAEQTALALGRKYKVRDELSPGGSVDDMLTLVQWPRAKFTALVVGHQPTLGAAIARLLNLREGDCSVRKGAVWWLRYRERDGAGQTVVLTVQSPEFVHP